MADDTKLTLFFRRLPVGFLRRTADGYQYTSYTDNEDLLRELLIASDYGLWRSFKRQSGKLFPEFKEILDSCSRKDIISSAGINETDSMWEKLVKLSRLSFFTPNFYVGQTPESEPDDK